MFEDTTPFIIALVVAALASYEAWATIKQRRKDQISAKEFVSTETNPFLNRSDITSIMVIVATVTVTVLCIPYFGLFFSGTALVFTLALAMGTRPVWKSLVTALVTSSIVYLIFVKIFNVIFAF